MRHEFILSFVIADFDDITHDKITEDMVLLRSESILRVKVRTLSSQGLQEGVGGLWVRA